MRLSRIVRRGSMIPSQGVVLIYERPSISRCHTLQDLEPEATANPGRPELEEDGCNVDNWARVW